MKTRKGFVSNSSSSSFVVAGFFLDSETNSRLGVLKLLFPENIPEDKNELSNWENDMAHTRDNTWVCVAHRSNTLPKGKTLVGVRINELSQSLLFDVETQVGKIRNKLALSQDDYPTLLISGNTND